jgi:DNA replication protein DnaC
LNQLQEVQNILKSLRLAETADRLPELIREAEVRDLSFTQFLLDVATYEQKRRDEKQLERRFKWATFPFHSTVDEYDVNEQKSLSSKKLMNIAD